MNDIFGRLSWEALPFAAAFSRVGRDSCKTQQKQA